MFIDLCCTIHPGAFNGGHVELGLEHGGLLLEMPEAERLLAPYAQAVGSPTCPTGRQQARRYARSCDRIRVFERRVDLLGIRRKMSMQEERL
jgi:hypothetical protein